MDKTEKEIIEFNKYFEQLSEEGAWKLFNEQQYELLRLSCLRAYCAGKMKGLEESQEIFRELARKNND
jgi:hypothetical protein